MVLRVIDEPVVGENNALTPALLRSQRVNVALGVGPAVFFGENALVVSEAAAADAFAGGVGLERAALPTERLRLLFGNEVLGQMAVGVNVERNVFFCCVCAVFLDGGRFFLLRVCEFLHRLRSLLHGINRLRCIAAGREAQKQRQQKKQRRQLPFHIHSPCHRFIILTQIARLRNCRPARSVLE